MANSATIGSECTPSGAPVLYFVSITALRDRPSTSDAADDYSERAA